MRRYKTDVRDGVLYIKTDDGWFKAGQMNDICILIGAETYTIEYDERQRSMEWLNTDSEGRLTFDVHESIAGMDYDEEFVTDLLPVDADATDDEGYPLRASVFADRMTEIWDSRGALDP
jgi:hypothetical protein